MRSTCDESDPAQPSNGDPMLDAVASRAPALRRISSRSIFGGDKEIEIDHEGVVYRLRVTALGKLILTK